MPESAACGIAIDMGASHLRFVLASVEGQILKESRERVHSEAGPRGVIAQIREGIARLIQSKNGLGTLRGIAIGVRGASTRKRARWWMPTTSLDGARRTWGGN